MTADQWDAATRRFDEAVRRRVTAMQNESRGRTDEVGYTRSQFEQYGPRPVP
jgi:hypothetical protein